MLLTELKNELNWLNAPRVQEFEGGKADHVERTIALLNALNLHRIAKWCDGKIP